MTLSMPMPGYQQGLANVANQASNAYRNIPDLSMIATNIDVFQPVKGVVKNVNVQGTSAAAPLFAAFLALVNQKAVQQGVASVGFANPVLYAIAKTPALASAFNDIADMSTNPPNSAATSNGYVPSSAPAGGFPAVAGYDLATGLGSPTCTLLNQLASVTPLIPVEPPTPLTGVPAFAGIGLEDMCVSNNGTVECWGADLNGEDGTGSNGSVDTTQHLSPICPWLTFNGHHASSLAMGVGHVCAIVQEDKSVSCWGQNDAGQLGLQAMDTQVTPPRPITPFTAVTVQGLPSNDPPIQVAAGGSTNCLLMQSGDVWCWGRNDKGQLGRGLANPDPNPAPTKIFGISPIAQVAIDPFGDYVCALTQNGGIYCWGHGPLGNGSSSDSLIPQQVKLDFDLGSISHATYISTGPVHACAIIANSGTSPGDGLWCWGDNGGGELGTGNTAVKMNVATPASVLTSMPTSVACGTFFTCVSVPGGIARCWGANDAGQLGNGNTSTSPQLTPTQVTGASGVAGGCSRDAACLRPIHRRTPCLLGPRPHR